MRNLNSFNSVQGPTESRDGNGQRQQYSAGKPVAEYIIGYSSGPDSVSRVFRRFPSPVTELAVRSLGGPPGDAVLTNDSRSPSATTFPIQPNASSADMSRKSRSAHSLSSYKKRQLPSTQSSKVLHDVAALHSSHSSTHKCKAKFAEGSGGSTSEIGQSFASRTEKRQLAASGEPSKALSAWRPAGGADHEVWAGLPIKHRCREVAVRPTSRQTRKGQKLGGSCSASEETSSPGPNLRRGSSKRVAKQSRSENSYAAASLGDVHKDPPYCSCFQGTAFPSFVEVDHAESRKSNRVRFSGVERNVQKNESTKENPIYADDEDSNSKATNKSVRGKGKRYCKAEMPADNPHVCKEQSSSLPNGKQKCNEQLQSPGCKSNPSTTQTDEGQLQSHICKKQSQRAEATELPCGGAGLRPNRCGEQRTKTNRQEADFSPAREQRKHGSRSSSQPKSGTDSGESQLQLTRCRFQDTTTERESQTQARGDKSVIGSVSWKRAGSAKRSQGSKSYTSEDRALSDDQQELLQMEVNENDKSVEPSDSPSIVLYKSEIELYLDESEYGEEGQDLTSKEDIASIVVHPTENESELRGIEEHVNEPSQEEDEKEGGSDMAIPHGTSGDQDSWAGASSQQERDYFTSGEQSSAIYADYVNIPGSHTGGTSSVANCTSEQKTAAQSRVPVQSMDCKADAAQEMKDIIRMPITVLGRSSEKIAQEPLKRIYMYSVEQPADPQSGCEQRRSRTDCDKAKLDQEAYTGCNDKYRYGKARTAEERQGAMTKFLYSQAPDQEAVTECNDKYRYGKARTPEDQQSAMTKLYSQAPDQEAVTECNDKYRYEKARTPEDQQSAMTKFLYSQEAEMAELAKSNRPCLVADSETCLAKDGRQDGTREPCKVVNLCDEARMAKCERHFRSIYEDQQNGVPQDTTYDPEEEMTETETEEEGNYLKEELVIDPDIRESTDPMESDPVINKKGCCC